MTNTKTTNTTRSTMLELEEQLRDITRWINQANCALKRDDWSSIEAQLSLIRDACPYGEYLAGILKK